MIDGIAIVLTYAVGVAISPVPVIAVVMILFSARAKANAPAFLAGWIAALAVVSGVAYALADAGDASTDSGAADTVSWVRIVFGVLLLLAAAKQWRSRPAPGQEADMPAWMASIDQLTPGKSLGLGLLLAGVNPKNLLLAAGAGMAVAAGGITGSDAVAALVVFVVLASVTVAGPVVYSLVAGERATAQLDQLKAWLAVHNAAVMAVVLLVLGVKLVADGLPVLGG